MWDSSHLAASSLLPGNGPLCSRPFPSPTTDSRLENGHKAKLRCSCPTVLPAHEAPVRFSPAPPPASAPGILESVTVEWGWGGGDFVTQGALSLEQVWPHLSSLLALPYSSSKARAFGPLPTFPWFHWGRLPISRCGLLCCPLRLRLWRAFGERGKSQMRAARF